MMQGRRDEFALIDYLTGTSKVPGSLHARIPVGNGDDSAIVKGRNGYDWVVCCDTMVEDVHFKRKTMNPFDIGFKALASNISDIAAMGGIPLFYLVSIAIPSSWTEEELGDIYRGMGDLASAHSMALIGGDTVSSPVSLTITVTVLGEIEEGKGLTRTYAREGDLVFLTGHVGDSGAGLDILLHMQNGIMDINKVPEYERPLIEKHCRPMPEVKAGRILAESGWRIALNDISDGLASESWEIARGSRVKLCLDEASIPLSREIIEYGKKRKVNPLTWAYNGGEDYTLIGCVPQEGKDGLEEKFHQAGLPIYWIGEVKGGAAEVVVKRKDGTWDTLEKKGYNHFPEDKEGDGNG